MGRLARKALDGLQYSILAVGTTILVGGAASVLVAGDLVPMKWFLFLAGLLSAFLGTLKLRPKAAWKDEQRRGLANDRTDEGYGAFVRELPPVAWLDYERGDYLSDGSRMLLLGVVALASSFVLEAVFGVGVPSIGGGA